MSQQTDALMPVLDLIVDGVQDGMQAVKNGKNVIADAPLLMQLVQDMMAAAPNAAGVPAAVKALSADDVEVLVAHVVTKMAIADDHARVVVQAVLKLAGSAAELLIALASKPAAAPAPAAS